MKGTAVVVVAMLVAACQGGAKKEKKAEAPPPAVDPAPPADPVQPVVEPTGPRRALLVNEDGYWLAIEGQPPKQVPKGKDGFDTAALAAVLDDFQSRHREAQLDLAAEDAVRYQDVITAMDTALSRGMTDVALVSAGLLPVKLPPEGGKLPARCNDNAQGGARPAEGDRAPIATLPVIVVKMDGSGSFAGTDRKQTEFAAPKGCEMDIPALVAWLKAGGHKAIIVQADKDATAGMIHRVLRSANAGGANDVLFAVKNN